MDDMTQQNRPHQGQPVLIAGEPIEQAKAAMIMLHGRGASPEDILGLTTEIHQPGFVYLAPQAADYTWYPYSFLSPIEKNEPGLSSALTVITDLLAHLDASGISAERTILLGFSQGACLSLEFAARNARRYGGVAGLSGGLIGPDGIDRNYAGSLANTPVFLGCSDRDQHIPKERVDLSAQVFEKLGAAVTERIYPRMGHTINEDEITFVIEMMKGLLVV
ncbi:alpha/beta hydrolase [Tengunoibacter tsumagoiensis]|uniref:Phospholipase/carboxylesterase n=1 Tax=Tengunoibacter tsumagoiensis TaxID=2014871 RepID=A0A402AA08_9CHLR|nr:dienelactone hydrolase family protein [Tengunoibacter tsumagoiensis]GCE15980.1 phospholipase/carboxylesterase [Tengunoibacter tsumagoiensis]